ncbi:MAG: hypothetical protein N2381_07525 [Armatimonadetes bacterium]|nr:hypothetical protein [Armatimonadota bacterium]MCX7777888.1 hypothetical protein [Armatimonadota bacterium]
MINKEIDKDEILITFCIIDGILKALGMQGAKQQEMSESEVLTLAWISHRYFCANYQATLSFLASTYQTLFPRILSKSRFARRIHYFLEFLPTLLSILSQIKQKISLRSRYFIDSFPIPVCENIRISRSKLMKGEEKRGYIVIPLQKIFVKCFRTKALPMPKNCCL